MVSLKYIRVCGVCRFMMTSEARHLPAEAGPGIARHWRQSKAWTLITAALPWAAAVGLALAIWFGSPLDPPAKVALIVFALAIVGWCLTGLDDTLIALTAAALLVLTGARSARDLHSALGNDMTWLLIGAFIIAAALRSSGLTERLARAALSKATSVTAVFFYATGMILATALVVPSTSGRATLLLPVYLALASVLRDVRTRRALALLFPTVILLSAGGSLIGAGAHLIAVEMIQNSGGPAYGFLGWLVLGMPLALMASFAATAVILLAFLSQAERRLSIALPHASDSGMTAQQRYVAVIVLAVVAGWCSQSFHGVDAAMVTLCGAIALTIKPFAPINLKEATKSVEWQLILFLAATTLMGQALIATGAAKALLQPVLALLPAESLARPALVATMVTVLALLSHLLITSRSARASVLIPLLATPLAESGYDFGAVTMLVVMATGFCQTLPASAKPVALYADLEHETYRKRYLALLSAFLLPLFAGLLLMFSLWIWPAIGLSLR